GGQAARAGSQGGSCCLQAQSAPFPPATQCRAGRPARGPGAGARPPAPGAEGSSGCRTGGGCGTQRAAPVTWYSSNKSGPVGVVRERRLHRVFPIRQVYLFLHMKGEVNVMTAFPSSTRTRFRRTPADPLERTMRRLERQGGVLVGVAHL